MKEQEYDHQRRPRPPVENIPPSPLFSLDDARKAMNYPHLLSEAEGWGGLQVMLGNFTPEDRDRYLHTVTGILEALSRQVLARMNRARDPERFTAALRGDAFVRLFDEILARWDEIYSPEQYVGTALDNMPGSG